MEPIEVSRTATFPAPADDVWELVSDARRAEEWFDFADRTKVVSGSGVGQLRTQYGHFGRRHSEVDQEVTEWEPGRVLAWRHVAERVDGRPAPKFASRTEFRIELSPAPDGTTVTLRSIQVPGGTFKGWLMRMLGTKDIERNMSRSLDRLAELLA